MSSSKAGSKAAFPTELGPETGRYETQLFQPYPNNPTSTRKKYIQQHARVGVPDSSHGATRYSILSFGTLKFQIKLRKGFEFGEGSNGVLVKMIDTAYLSPLYEFFWEQNHGKSTENETLQLPNIRCTDMAKNLS